MTVAFACSSRLAGAILQSQAMPNDGVAKVGSWAEPSYDFRSALNNARQVNRAAVALRSQKI
jgi:hypothetical protein